MSRLEVACTRCKRQGSYTIETAIERWGDARLTDLLIELTMDCPHGKGASAYDRCGAYYPALKS